MSRLSISAALTPRLETVGMDALMVRLFDAIDEAHMPWILAADSALRAHLGDALVDLVPSYTTLLVHYDIARLDQAEAKRRIHTALEGLAPASTQTGREHRIPVWYDESVGPELATIAERLGVDQDEIIRRHTARDYCAFALGFTPGYAFMGMIEEALATPRLKTPRQKVAAGSVGIAERQTAIYSMRSPGGWNILGRTAVKLFDRGREEISLFRPGDRVRFEAVSRDVFIEQGGDTTPLEER
ncbi:5-oxoprolinase subunit B family protein [Salinicola avicenniae]|uniref:5-oxoprolinase subunit B family protein n=1 Tax=Salinicola avicenniae TaxID=2916836 RepID=UPI0020747DD0|nr:MULTISPECIES: allophanate hydrolase subunit 1 [unclassified Salinicola]